MRALLRSSACIAILFVRGEVAEAQSHREELNSGLRALTPQIFSRLNGFGLVVSANESEIVVVTAQHLLPKEGPAGDEPVAQAEFQYAPGDRIPLRRISVGTTPVKGDFAFLRGPRPPLRLPVECATDLSAAAPTSVVWLIGAPPRREGDHPWQADADTGEIIRVEDGKVRVTDLSTTMITGASGGPLIGDSGVVGIVASTLFENGFAVPIWDIIEQGKAAGVGFDRLRPCRPQLPPGEAAFQCLASRDWGCFADLALRSAAAVPEDAAFEMVAIQAANMLLVDTAMHAVRSIGSSGRRATTMARLTAIFERHRLSSAAADVRRDLSAIAIGPEEWLPIARDSLPKAGTVPSVSEQIAEHHEVSSRLADVDGLMFKAKFMLLLAAKGWSADAETLFGALRAHPLMLDPSEPLRLSDAEEFGRKMLGDGVMAVGHQQALHVIDLLRRMRQPLDTPSEDPPVDAIAAYCGQAETDADDCLRLATEIYRDRELWLRLHRVGEVASHMLRYGADFEKAAGFVERVRQEQESRLSRADPDSRDERRIRFDVAEAFRDLAAAILTDDRYTTTAHLALARALLKRGQEVLIDAKDNGLLPSFFELEFARGLLDEAAETLARILWDEAEEPIKIALLNCAVSEITWKNPCPPVPKIQLSLENELALSSGATFPLAVAEAAFKRRDQIRADEALKLATSIIKGDGPAVILGGQYEAMVATLKFQTGWGRFEATMALLRNMADDLLNKTPKREAEKALALVLYRHVKVSRGDAITKALDFFAWEDERPLAMARAAGLAREGNVDEALRFLTEEARLPGDPIEIRQVLASELSNAGYFRDAFNLILAGQTDRIVGSLQTLAADAAASGDLALAREIAGWLAEKAPEEAAYATNAIARVLVIQEKYADAVSELGQLGGGPVVPTSYTDQLLYLSAEGLLKSQQFRAATEAVNFIRDPMRRLEGYLVVGAALAR